MSFNRSALPELTMAIAHLREVLGEDAYESFTRTGEHMTTAEIVAYGLEQIDTARATLT